MINFVEKKCMSVILFTFITCSLVFILNNNSENIEDNLIYKNDILNYEKLDPIFKNNINDTLLKQLYFIPNNYIESTAVEKKILILSYADNLGIYPVEDGNRNFQKCLVKKCSIFRLQDYQKYIPDSIIYRETFVKRSVLYKPRQVHVFFTQECPNINPKFTNPSIINWTATYRKDSDIPVPYSKWVYYNNEVKSIKQSQNFASGKKKKVAWVVSNCAPYNNRTEYAKELQKYIEVDIYGNCGNKSCSKEGNCFEKLELEYKFYLSFENSYCKEYITEKLFTNALHHNMVPIVMGARHSDYVEIAPKNSFIYARHYKDPKHLAEYLHKLDQNDTLYNSYFQWRGTGQFVGTSFLCRLCAMLHSDYKEKSYKDINAWYQPKNVCVKTPWNKL